MKGANGDRRIGDNGDPQVERRSNCEPGAGRDSSRPEQSAGRNSSAGRKSRAAREQSAGARRAVRPERPVVPDRARDDLDIGWGDDPAFGRDPGARADDWYQRERPPHYE